MTPASAERRAEPMHGLAPLPSDGLRPYCARRMPDPDFLADFLARARTRLLQSPPAGSDEAGAFADNAPANHAFGDHAFSPGLAAELPAGPGKPAAVLIPIVKRPGGATILLTRRSSALRNHSGQIAFPGGRIDVTDDGPLGAALREADEEIGLARSLVEPVGYLDVYITASGYRIVPVIALVEPGFSLELNRDEVDAVFECPLAFAMEPANQSRETRDWRGAARSYYAIYYAEHYIWGVTAGILRTLYERIYI
jgi:8-oxo-dGTP pyrophosphatase MutT (NUDIX family)